MKTYFLGAVLAICLHAPTAQAQTKPAPKPTPAQQLKKLKADFKDLSVSSDCDQIIPMANKILALDARDTAALVRKCVCLARAEKPDLVVPALRQFYQPADTAVNMVAYFPFIANLDMLEINPYPYYDSAIAMAPNNGLAYVLKGAEMADEGKTAESIALVEKGYPMLPPQVQKQFESMLGYMYALNKQTEKALNLTLPVLQNTPGEPDYVKAAAQAYINAGQYDKAMALVDKAIAANEVESNLRQKGRIYEAQGDTARACTEAAMMEEKYGGYKWLKEKLYCEEIRADIQPKGNSTQYQYVVEVGSSGHEFIVSNPRVNMQQGISYEWTMKVGNDMDGEVSISQAAMDTAHEQMNRYANGNYNLNNKTSVWISNAVYRELKQQGWSLINADGETKKFVVLPDNRESDFDGWIKVNGTEKFVKHLRLRSEDGEEELWIADNAANPLILRMQLSFTIWLSNVEQR